MTDFGTAARLRAAFELSPTILSVSDLETGRLLEVNEAFLRVTGWTREEIIGRPIPEIGFWIDPELRFAGLATLRTGGTVRDLEARFRTKAGEEVVAIANADLVDVDGRPCVITALIDITARVRAEAALRDSERRFEQFFRVNPLPMSITRLSDGRRLDVNEAAVRHSGYTREQMLSLGWEAGGLLLSRDERIALAARLRRDGHAHDYEVTFRTKAGEIRTVLVNSELITSGGDPAALNVYVDITERKQAEAEQAARRAEAESVARAKDEFLAMLGHELRNPLGTITNALAILNRRAGDDELRRFTTIIGRQAKHLTRLVDDLLDVARVTSGKIDLRSEPVELRALARRCVDALAQAGRTSEHLVTVEGDALHVYGDPARLEQVVSNLLDNALKYTPRGGAVAVRTAAAGGQAVLSVRDTGAGIRPDVLDRIFDLFVQGPQALDRSRGGLGLGLTLVKRLVELHGGAVAAASEGAGRGCEFTIRLPVVEAPAVTAARAAAPAAEGLRRRVVIVEDNADARESLQLLLRLAGHDVETAEDGLIGLQKLTTLRPDVALIDLGLPGIDGYDLARRLRALPEARAMRLIAISGYGQAEDRRRALDAGFDLHITKPVDPDRLQRLLAGGVA
jgi:PAS domain S-box-containing protein